MPRVALTPASPALYIRRFHRLPRPNGAQAGVRLLYTKLQ